MIVLKATQDKVLAVLQSVAGIVERRHTLPILANVLLRKTGNAIQLTTSDLEIQIRTTAELGGDTGDFTTTVGARKLIDILKTMPSDQTVSLESSQSKLILKGGKSRFTLQTLPAEDFPLVQEAASFGPAFSVPQKVLKSLLGQVSFAMAVQDIRYYLNGILFVAEGTTLSLVATDGHRLAFASAQLDVEVPKQEVILPRKTVLELQRLLSDADGAIENDTWPIRSLSTFCGTLNAGPNAADSCTSGKSSAGRLCSVKRLLPPLRISLDWLDSRLTVWSAGMVFRMSMSLRAPTVVVKSPVSPPSSAVVRIWISRSLVVSWIALPVLRISTLARMGSVCRRSTMPDTDCKTARTLSCVAFRTIMSSTFGGFGRSAQTAPSASRPTRHFAFERGGFRWGGGSPGVNLSASAPARATAG